MDNNKTLDLPELLLDAPPIPGTDSPYPPEPKKSVFILPRMVGTIRRDRTHTVTLPPPSLGQLRPKQQTHFPPARPGEPQQVAPAPLPPPQLPLRSVLKR